MSMMMRSSLQRQASVSPVYSKKPDLTRQQSLRDHYLENVSEDSPAAYTNKELELSDADDNDAPPPLSDNPSSTGNMSKFMRAVKRLRNTHMATRRRKDAGVDFNEIKRLVSRSDIRHDVTSLSRCNSEKPLDDDHEHGAAGVKAPSQRKALMAFKPSSGMMITWNLMQFVLFVYVIVYIPYRVAFAGIADTSSTSGCNKDAVVEGIDLFVDTFYLVDLVISACTQTTSDRGFPLLYLKETIPNYVLSWVFIRDVAPAVPMSWIEFAASQNCNSQTVAQAMGVGPDSQVRDSTNDNLIKLLRIMRIFRILRVFKLLNIEFVNRIMRQVDPNFKTLGSLFAALTMLVHLLACLWFYFKKDSQSIDAWYEEQRLSESSNRPIRVYLACVYYIIATLATVGYGDISADHAQERIVSVIIMLIGTIVFALIISTASMIVQGSGAEDAAHGSKIAMVHEFCSKWNIHEELKYQILDYFLASKEVFLENNNIRSVMSLLPVDYQSTVAPHVAKDCIMRTALFKGCNPEFLSLLLELLSLESFNANDIIFQSGDISHCFYIIKSGTCLVVNDCNIITAELSDTDVFGEISCLFSAPRAYTCVCAKFCELYVLSAARLAKIFKIFPDFKKFFTEYSCKKVLLDMSTKRQLSSLLRSTQDTPSFACSGSSSQPPLSPALCALSHQPRLVQLDPLPKGKFRPPKIPDVPGMICAKSAHLAHGERVKLIAEIQMSLSNFDFLSLAVKYDRIMNALHGAARARESASKSKSCQAEVLSSILKTISLIVAAYGLHFRFDSQAQPVGVSQHSNLCSQHLVPGSLPWRANLNAPIEVDTTNSDQFFGFLMSVATTEEPAVLVDQRSRQAAQRTAS